MGGDGNNLENVVEKDCIRGVDWFDENYEGKGEIEYAKIQAVIIVAQFSHQNLQSLPFQELTPLCF